jgi:exodeoxyribonuclease (lambda-induced)
MKIIDIEQGTPEWHKLREKRMTASHAQSIKANGKGLITYIRELMTNYYSTAENVVYTNPAMEHGNEQEEVAAMVYEFETGNKTEIVGFVELDEYVGCSPDRFVDSDGMIEIKCPQDKAYFNLLLDEKIDTKYLAQMQMQMYVCDRKWCDYVVYNPNFEQQLFIKRVERNESVIEQIKVGIETGKKLMNEIQDKIGEIK